MSIIHAAIRLQKRLAGIWHGIDLIFCSAGVKTSSSSVFDKIRGILYNKSLALVLLDERVHEIWNKEWEIINAL